MIIHANSVNSKIINSNLKIANTVCGVTISTLVFSAGNIFNLEGSRLLENGLLGIKRE